MNENQILKNLSEEIHTMHVKKENAKLKLTELEKEEKIAVQKLMQATLREKKGNETMLKATQESLDYLLKKLDERKANNENLIKKINQKRNNSLMIDNEDGEVSQNHSNTTKSIMEKIQEQTEIIEKQTIILHRTCESKESIKHFRSKITDLKSEIVNKQNELEGILNVYFGLNKVCQDMHQKNINKSLACRQMEEKSILLQSNVDLLNNDIKKLTSE